MEEDLEGRDHTQRVKINFRAAAPGWLPPLFTQTHELDTISGLEELSVWKRRGKKAQLYS